MKEYDLHVLLNDDTLVSERIKRFLAEGILRMQQPDPEETRGHLQKADHNLRFVAKAIEWGFPDWAITGCYYACYQAAMALILTRGYSSKNHLATLCILIKHFYRKELSKEDIATLSQLLDYQDVLYYVESKNKREDASYSSRTRFDRTDVEKLRIRASLFVSKIKSILTEDVT